MSSIKCPNCGLINFASATECKRCKQTLEVRSYPYWQGNSPVESPKPDWSKLQTVPAVPDETVNLDDHGDGSHPIGNILFGIYLALTTLMALYSLSVIRFAATRESWKLATDPESKVYLASYEPFYYLAWFGAVAFFLGAATLLFTLCLKSKAFLRLVVIYLVGEFIYFCLQIWFFFRLEAELREKHIPELELAANLMQWLPYLSMIYILLAFIWFRYFTTSKRARSVFE